MPLAPWENWENIYFHRVADQTVTNHRPKMTPNRVFLLLPATPSSAQRQDQQSPPTPKPTCVAMVGLSSRRCPRPRTERPQHELFGPQTIPSPIGTAEPRSRRGRAPPAANLRSSLLLLLLAVFLPLATGSPWISRQQSKQLALSGFVGPFGKFLMPSLIHLKHDRTSLCAVPSLMRLRDRQGSEKTACPASLHSIRSLTNLAIATAGSVLFILRTSREKHDAPDDILSVILLVRCGRVR